LRGEVFPGRTEMKTGIGQPAAKDAKDSRRTRKDFQFQIGVPFNFEFLSRPSRNLRVLRGRMSVFSEIAL
jgi:hypothetical protein